MTYSIFKKVFFSVTATLIALMPLSASAKWLRAETDAFVVYSNINEPRTKQKAQELQKFDQVLRTLFKPGKIRSKRKLDVYLFKSAADIKKIFPNVSSDTYGAYAARPGAIIAASYGFSIGRADGLDQSSYILFHEYAHHYMRQHFSRPFPLWYVEGFAEFVATTKIEKDRAIIGWPAKNRLDVLQNSKFIPIEQFLVARPAEARRLEAAKFYAQSWLAVHYFYSNPEREGQLLQYLNGFRSKQEKNTEFFIEVIGEDLRKFQKKLDVYLRRQISAFSIPFLEGSQPAIKITRLSKIEQALLIPNARLRIGVKREEAQDIWRRLEKISPSSNDKDKLALLRTKAHTASWLNDFDQSISLLDSALKINSEDLQTLHLSGLTRVLKARRSSLDTKSALHQEARTYFDRALKVDPTHYSTLLHRAETTPSNDARLNYLLQSWQFAPQVELISLRLARALIEANRLDDALKILQPLLYQPHRASNNKSAQDLVLAIQKLKSDENLK